MGTVVLRIALVGTSIMLASGHAFGEAKPPAGPQPQQAAPPQPQPAPQKPASAAPQPKTSSAAGASKNAPQPQAAPQQQPKTGAQSPQQPTSTARQTKTAPPQTKTAAPQQPTSAAPQTKAAMPQQPSAAPQTKTATPQTKTATPQTKAPAKTANTAPPAAKAAQTQDQGGNDFAGGQATQVPPIQPAAGDGALSPPQPRCQITPTTGTPIFEARYVSGTKAVITKLYASGTFTRVVLKQSPLRTSCIEANRLSAIRTALAESPWQTTKRPSECAATSKETTEIYAAGKLRFTSRQCNPLVLDVQSSKALDLIGVYVGPFGLDMADMIEAD